MLAFGINIHAEFGAKTVAYAIADNIKRVIRYGRKISITVKIAYIQLFAAIGTAAYADKCPGRSFHHTAGGAQLVKVVKPKGGAFYNKIGIPKVFKYV